MDVICLGAAVLDITAAPVGKQDTWKEKQRIGSIAAQIGGDAANQSARLADLGVSAALVTCIGGDTNGQVLLGLLKERGIMTQLIRVRKDSGTGTALVLVDPEGGRHTFSTRGAHSELSLEDCGFLLERDGAFFEEKQIRALSVGSIFSMPRLEAEGLYEILKTARRKGVLTFGDLSADKRGQGFEGVRRFLPELDYFLPSIYDAREMTGLPTPEAIAEFYLGEGAKTVVIKLGEKGAYYRTEKEEGLVPAGNVKPVDTTGAGDCMNALFISRILAGDDTCTALRRACAGASLSTAFAGAAGGRITEKELLNL